MRPIPLRKIEQGMDLILWKLFPPKRLHHFHILSRPLARNLSIIRQHYALDNSGELAIRLQQFQDHLQLGNLIMLYI